MLEPSHDFLLDLVILLLLAKLLSLPLRPHRIHPVVGHVLAGVILGPYFLGLVRPSIELESIARLGLLLLLFYTGLTTDFRELRRKSAALITMGVLGVAATFTLTYYAVGLLGYTGLAAVFISIAVSNTATETVAAALQKTRSADLKALVVGASFVDDIAAVFVISILSSITSGGGYGELAYLSVSSIALILGVIALSQLLIGRLTWFYRKLSKDYIVFASMSLVIALSLSLAARLAGLSELIGAYLAGLLVGRGREFHDPMLKTKIALVNFIDDLSIILEVLFIPLFFTYVGLLFEAPRVNTVLLATLLATAMAGKIIACTPIAYIVLRSPRKSIAAGIAMTGRGALETALLKLGLDYGIIDISIYSTVILATMTTAVLAPLLYGIIASNE